jgi:acyl-CoA dehydrogenase
MTLFSGDVPDVDEEMIALRDLVRSFVRREILPAEAEALRLDLPALPDHALAELQQKARAAGLWCFETPEEYGGLGLDEVATVLVVEEASKHTFCSPDPGGGAFGYDPPNILLGATQEQRKRYIGPAVEGGLQWCIGISEPTGGSDPARAIRTRAQRRPGGWVLNGRKLWTSRADVASHGIFFARTDTGRAGISAFIVDLPAPGVSVRKLPVIRDHHTTEVALDDVEVADEALLGQPGQGFALAQAWLGRSRLRVSAQALGMAQAALDLAVEHAKLRETFGKPLAARQSVQNLLVDAHVDLTCSRLLLHAVAAGERAARKQGGATSMVKLRCTEAAFKAVDSAMQIFGGMGVSREMPLEHWFRNLRVSRIIEGPSEIHRFAIAREMLGARATE